MVIKSSRLVHNLNNYRCFTLDFSSLLKNHYECSFVSSECSLQSSNVRFEVFRMIEQ